MNQTLHTNHIKHLEGLKQRSQIAVDMLKVHDLEDQQREAISQGKEITDMMFENGMNAFKNPLK